jgi:hypothetical protein
MNAVLTIQPRQRTIVAVDIEGSTERNNAAKARLRDDMYDLLERALLDSGITEDLREPFHDRGDGAIALIHPADTVPKTLLLSTFIPRLNEELVEHATSPVGFRLRAAIHSGDVHFDRRGMFGEDIDVTMRTFEPLVHLRVGGLSYQGWVQVPGEPVWIDRVS